MGKREHEVAAVAYDSMDLAQDARQVGDERQRRHRQRQVDLIGADERQLGRMTLVELDRHLVAVGETASRGDLGHVGVGGGHPGSPQGQSHRVVAGPAPEHQHSFPVHIADEPAVEVDAEAGTEVHVVEGPVGVGSPGVVRDHAPSLADASRARAAPLPLRPMKLGLSEAIGGGGGGIDYRLAREATLQAWRSGDLSAEQVCDAQRELRRNAEFCGSPTSRSCPVCELSLLVEVTYVFGPRLPRHGRCVTSDRELTRIDARKASYQGYVVEVCTECGWNHLTRSRALGRGGAI